MKPLAVYVHIPFCVRKCGYCDFNAHAGMDALKGEYADAVVAEMRAWRAALGERRVTSIALRGRHARGDGARGESGAIVAAVREAWPVDEGAEIGLEANPGTTSGADLRALVAAGVTRVSFGAQSFEPDALRFLDRIHTPEAIASSVRLAREAGIASVNLDLLYGLPGQTMAAWVAGIERALALAPDHLSLYALTVEDGTPLAASVDSGAVTMPDADLVADMYECATDLLAADGIVQYELSNWARPGHESRHNQAYWRHADYLGLGAGAHGFVDGGASRERRPPPRLRGRSAARRPRESRTPTVRTAGRRSATGSRCVCGSSRASRSASSRRRSVSRSMSCSARSSTTAWARACSIAPAGASA